MLYNKFNDRCRRDPWFQQNGVSVLLICTYRSAKEQDELYEQGRTKPGRIVTNAKGGKSKHNAVAPDGKPAAEAFDVVPLRAGKMPVWGVSGDGVDDNPADDCTDDLEAWHRAGAHGVAVGLKWYGTPGSAFREFPHFEFDPKSTEV